jgi:hypothetical protein
VSFGTPAGLLFGLVLILASLALFLTSKFKPDLYQESDNIYAVIGIICGLLLLINFNLDPAMAFQQLLMIGSLITIMWQFLQVRAENKRLKGGGRSAGREPTSRKSGYSARIDDEPEYAPAKRGNRRNEDRFDRSNNEREDPEELPSRRSATRQLPEERFTDPRRRLTEPTRTEVNSLYGRQNDSWDSDEDWNYQEPVQVRRALPDADLASNQSDRPDRRSTRSRGDRQDQGVPPRRRRDSENNNNNEDLAPSPRRRPRTDRPSRQPGDLADGNRQQRDDIGQGEGTTANYVDYEPLALAKPLPQQKPLDARIDPPSGLPPSGSEPIVFPDRY